MSNLNSKQNVSIRLENVIKQLLNSELCRDERLSLGFLSGFLEAYRLTKEPENLHEELNNTETDLMNYIRLSFYTEKEIRQRYVNLGLKLGKLTRIQELYLQQKQYKQDK